MINKKTVCLPIGVPSKDYCCDFKGQICYYFDNEGGHGTCDLNVDTIDNNHPSGLFIKPGGCKNLKEIK